eukprot:8501419-Pyramimonas_sp.AAC.1
MRRLWSECQHCGRQEYNEKLIDRGQTCVCGKKASLYKPKKKLFAPVGGSGQTTPNSALRKSV